MKTWKFKLTYGSSSFDCTGDMVINWDSISLKLERNDMLRGALFQYSNVFEFIGRAKDFVQKVVDGGGMEAELYLQMFEGNESGHKGSFIRLGQPIKASLKTYDNNGTIAKVTFAISGFEEKIFNRYDAQIEYGIKEAIDGEALIDAIYADQRLHDRVLSGVAEIVMDETRVSVLGTAEYDPINSNTGAIFTIKNSSIQEVVSSFNIDFPPLQGFFQNAINKASVRVVIKDLAIHFGKQAGASFICTRAVFIVKLDVNNNEYPGRLNVASYYDRDFVLTSDFNINEDFTVELIEGDSIAIKVVVEFIATGAGAGWHYEFKNNGSVDIDSRSYFPATITKAISPFDAINRIVSQITGKEDAFKSNYLGYTEKGYAVDGEGAFNMLLSGKLIRSFPVIDAKISFSLSDLMSNFIKAFNLVAWIENDVLRLEKYNDAFDLNRIIKIEKHGNVSVNLIEKMHFSNIKYGYNNQSYEESTGLDNTHGLFERQTHIKSTKNSLDLIVQYRTDSEGIELARRLDYVYHAKQDYRADNDIFIIQSKIGFGTEINSIEGSEIGTIEGVLSPNTAYNMGLTPRDIFKNWSNVISSGLYLYPQKKIKFVSGASNTALVVNGVAEKSDIEVASLTTPLFLPYNLMVEDAFFAVEQLNYLKQYPNAVIEIGNYYGIVDEMDIDLNTMKTNNLKLIRVNR